MKIFLGLCCVMLTSFCFASIEKINEKQLLGSWSCTSSFVTDKLKIVEVSNALINADGGLLQNGMVYYEDANDKATLEYEMNSVWTINNNQVKFTNVKFNKFYMKNQEFNKRYNIIKSLLTLEDKKEDYYTILKLTEDKLVMSQRGSNVQENCKRT